ncbi:hypothetical protein [Gemmata sp.]|uniref:hypothetical protein n=1 Tax=Gemmata sp. TaxID=1914242 RepID=UPI003F70884C
MILFTRADARDFRVLFGRCVAGRPRGPAPPVVVRVRAGVRTLAATTAAGVTLTHATPAPDEPDDVVVVPAAVLAGAEGNADGAVSMDRGTKLTGVVRWTCGTGPRTLPVDLVLPGRQHEVPAPPAAAAVAPDVLAALHACGRAAARESGRFALSRVQLQGRHGRVVGTDGKVALLWGGFTLPFADDVLVPALPVFGAKPLAGPTTVTLARTAAHLVVAAGPWAVWLPTDAGARYPDVAGVVPRDAAATVRIDPADAAALLPVLPGLPGGDRDVRPVTLDADRGVRVRGWAREGEQAGETREVVLERSTHSGAPVRVALDRRVLVRALALGCRTALFSPDRPVVFAGGDRTLLAAPLDPALLAPPTTTASESPTLPTRSERSPPVKAEPTGPAPPRGDPPEPLDLAEDLRAALAGAAGLAARLVSALRQGKREKKVLSALMTNLKQLHLGGAP